MIDITDLDPVDVLVALYNAAKPQGMSFVSYTPENMTKEEAKELLAGGERYFDYLKGRVMKIKIGSERLDERLYDRDNGDGAAARAIRSIERV